MRRTCRPSTARFTPACQESAPLKGSPADMIAWERHVDATRDDPAALPSRPAAPVAFADGAPAPYGFRLARRRAVGRALTGHGGAPRGRGRHRLHAAAERVPVVVLFNHLSDAQEAALGILAAVPGEARPAPVEAPPPPWLGADRAPETGLAARIEALPGGRVLLRFGHAPERLALAPDGSAGTGRTRLRPTPEGRRMERPQENRARLREPIAPDLWALPSPRALDHTPPGDRTPASRRDGAGRVAGVRVGCWLARRLEYGRVGD